ncbi:MAG: hypothetical protein FRX49_09686 [Trebouxia sp. A1-2]|nr:MAG: hypothetical protein FRX49_09686 [Trebouxia sp. A1-2]
MISANPMIQSTQPGSIDEQTAGAADLLLSKGQVIIDHLGNIVTSDNSSRGVWDTSAQKSDLESLQESQLLHIILYAAYAGLQSGCGAVNLVMNVFELAPQIIHEVLEGLQADCWPSLLWLNGSNSRCTVLLTVIPSGEGGFSQSLTGRQQLT